MNLKIVPKRYIVPVVYPLPKKCGRSHPKACNPSRGALNARTRTTKTVKKAYGKYKLTDRLEIMPMEVQHALATKYHYYGTWPSSGILAGQSSHLLTVFSHTRVYSLDSEGAAQLNSNTCVCACAYVRVCALCAFYR